MEWVMIDTGQSFGQLQNNINECMKQGWTIKDIKVSGCGEKDFHSFIVVEILENKEA